MRDGIDRRALVRGLVAMGAGCAFPAIARADGARADGVPAGPEGGPGSDFERAFQVLSDPSENAAALSPAAGQLDEPLPLAAGYRGAVVDLARRQLERCAPALPRSDLVAIADFARPSALPRLHIVDLHAGRLRSILVAHGRGSDPEHDGWLKSFSNIMGSQATSRGAYLVGDIYDGKYGPSLRLQGLDPDNSNAYDRAIVMHPAWYAAPEMLSRYGKLGRSEGCFAMDPQHFTQALAALAGGHLLYADRIEAG